MRVATGVYRDKFGFGIPIGGFEHRYPLTTPLEELRREKATLDRAHQQQHPRHRRGTLDAWFAEYLQTIPSTPRVGPDGTVREGTRRRDERALWRHWQMAGFGSRSPGSVTPLAIRQQLATWGTTPRGKLPGAPGKLPLADQPLTRATIKHLRRLLGAVYRTNAGKAGANPVRDVPAVTLRYEDARAVPYTILERIFAEMPDLGAGVKGTAKKDGGPGRSTINKTKLRLRVMAYTGMPPAQLKRIMPADVRLARHELHARPRRKGGGTDPKLLPLTDQGVRALRAFVYAQCFGWFDSRAAARVFRRAVIKAQQRWEAEQAQRPARQRLAWPVPPHVRAYDMRHSFGSAVVLETGNLQDAADLLLHTSLETTRRYTLAAVDPRLKRAAARLSRGTILGSTEMTR